MSGYIGTKSVTLSTTAATVGGDSTVGGDLTVDTNTLYVDSTNNRVGVGTVSPSATLDVNGTIKLDGNYPVATGNVALGDTALDSNVSGGSNTAIGADALTANTASNNTAVGFQAGYSNTTGDRNTFLGHTTGYNVTTGTFNTFLGYNSGADITTGAKNTILGRYNGNQGGLDIRTSSNNIVLSDGDGNPRIVDSSGVTMMGGKTVFGVTDTGVSIADDAGGRIVVVGNFNDYLIRFQNFNGGTRGSIILNSNSTVSYNTSSDYRLKENVVELTGATDRLKQLEPKRFNFIANADDTPVDGFLAHEVQTVVPEAIHGTKDEVDDDGNPVYQGIDQSKLVPLLTAALKESIAKIEALEARVTALESN